MLSFISNVIFRNLKTNLPVAPITSNVDYEFSGLIFSVRHFTKHYFTLPINYVIPPTKDIDIGKCNMNIKTSIYFFEIAVPWKKLDMGSGILNVEQYA